jgi:hypothetical protein
VEGDKRQDLRKLVAEDHIDRWPVLTTQKRYHFEHALDKARKSSGNPEQPLCTFGACVHPASHGGTPSSLHFRTEIDLYVRVTGFVPTAATAGRITRIAPSDIHPPIACLIYVERMVTSIRPLVAGCHISEWREPEPHQTGYGIRELHSRFVEGTNCIILNSNHLPKPINPNQYYCNKMRECSEVK